MKYLTIIIALLLLAFSAHAVAGIHWEKREHFSIEYRVNIETKDITDSLLYLPKPHSPHEFETLTGIKSLHVTHSDHGEAYSIKFTGNAHLQAHGSVTRNTLFEDRIPDSHFTISLREMQMNETLKNNSMQNNLSIPWSTSYHYYWIFLSGSSKLTINIFIWMARGMGSHPATGKYVKFEGNLSEGWNLINATEDNYYSGIIPMNPYFFITVPCSLFLLLVAIFCRIAYRPMRKMLCFVLHKLTPLQ